MLKEPEPYDPCNSQQVLFYNPEAPTHLLHEYKNYGEASGSGA